MNKITKVLNKYIFLLIASYLFGMPWLYIRAFTHSNFEPDSIMNSIPTYMNYLIRLIIIILLIMDFKKHELKNVLLPCIAAFFAPLLGIVILAILFIANEKNKSNA